MKLKINYFYIILILIILQFNQLIFCDEHHSAHLSNNHNYKEQKPRIIMKQPPPVSVPAFKNEGENSSYYWLKNAQEKLIEKLTNQMNFNKAKNVIFFLGDGMSIPTLAASRIYMGQLNGQTGEESELSFEKFPYVGLSKTYCIDKQVADSACTATAYLGGVKANYMTIGVNGQVKLQDCTSAKNQINQVSSIVSWAQDAGKSTGIVTTTRITHASPAGTYAHIADRDMECDTDIQNMNLTTVTNLKDCQDIASQLIYNQPGNKLNVILGGGRRKFLPKNIMADEKIAGERSDGINLIDVWKNSKKRAKSSSSVYVTNKTELKNINYNQTDYLLGLFNADHLKYHLDKNCNDDEPTLTEMTEAAIKILRKNRKGYFLFVEGGKIDLAHHDTMAQKALDETVQFSKAIERAVQLTSIHDTLIIVTSDHEHTMSFSGYSKRGGNILGLNSERSTIDNLPYLTLSYANGPGYRQPEMNNLRYDHSNDNFDNRDYLYPALVPLTSETHGGADVAVFALGPWSYLFSGVYEQHTIPHMISFASCIGKGYTFCSKKKTKL